MDTLDFAVQEPGTFAKAVVTAPVRHVEERLEQGDVAGAAAGLGEGLGQLYFMTSALRNAPRVKVSLTPPGAPATVVNVGGGTAALQPGFNLPGLSVLMTGGAPAFPLLCWLRAWLKTLENLLVRRKRKFAPRIKGGRPPGVRRSRRVERHVESTSFLIKRRLRYRTLGSPEISPGVSELTNAPAGFLAEPRPPVQLKVERPREKSPSTSASRS